MTKKKWKMMRNVKNDEKSENDEKKWKMMTKGSEIYEKVKLKKSGKMWKMDNTCFILMKEVKIDENGFANTGASLGVIREIHKAEKKKTSKKSKKHK